jgi:formate hydrogenlyase transcriptional activator
VRKDRTKLTSEEKYRLLLEVSEAANAQLEFPRVLEAVAHALKPIVPVDGIAAVTVDGDSLKPHALHVEGVEHRRGDSFADTAARAWDLSPEEAGRKFGEFPLAGSATEHVGRTRRAYVSQDLRAEQRFAEDGRLLASGVGSYVRTPLFVHDRLIGSIAFARKKARCFSPEEVALLEEVSRPIATAVANSLAYEEIEQLRDRLHEENLFLREEVEEGSMFGEIVGASPALMRVLAHVEKVAPTDATVLLTGETGTGKELVARAIHARSARAARPMIGVNCAALPESLIASELFGHEKGAFTGALRRRLGRFELATGGTLFLDEIGELPPDVQVALLRVLQEGEFQRVGGSETLRADARIIAATNRDLTADVEAGRFRRDLFYRLNVFPVDVPPLRERREDIPILVEYFAARHGARLGKKFRRVDRETMDRLLAYPWPGNIRELENVIERAAIVSEGDRLSLDETALPASGKTAASSAARRLPALLRDHEKRMIESVLQETRGRVSGARGAASRLGLAPTTLESKIKKLRINKHRFMA